MNHSGVFSWLVTSSEAAGDAGLVPNGTLNPRGLALSLHFCEVMLLWLWSADRGHITATKWTLLNAKMRNGTLYGLVDLTDTRACKTASAHEVFHLGQGRRLDEMNRSCSSAIEVASVCDTAWFNSVTHDGTNKCAKASSASFQF